MQQGIGIEETLEAVVSRIPAPQDTADQPLRALIFDSHYDSYKVCFKSHRCSPETVHTYSFLFNLLSLGFIRYRLLSAWAGHAVMEMCKAINVRRPCLCLGWPYDLLRHA